MKKLLVLFLVFGMASMANASLVELWIVSRGPAPDQTVPIDPTKEITIEPSEWIDIDLIYTADDAFSYPLDNLSVQITAVGAATLDMTALTNTGLPVWSQDPIFSPGVTENVPGKDYYLQYSVGMDGTGMMNDGAAIDHILLHCDEYPGDVTVAMVDYVFAGAGTVDWSMLPMRFGDPLIVHQIPEPMTVVLLGLGGLLLRRRR
jgi:hypothetical protein